jgi:hypothetical protein
MTALTQQKYELRRDAFTRMLAAYDAADEARRRRLFEEYLSAIAMSYTVPQLRQWIENIDRVCGPKVQP